MGRPLTQRRSNTQGSHRCGLGLLGRPASESKCYVKWRPTRRRHPDLGSARRPELAAGEQPFHASADGGEDLRHVLVARWGRGVKGELPWPSFAEDAVQHQRMEVDIQLLVTESRGS